MRRRHRLAALALVVLGWNAAVVTAPAATIPSVAALTYLTGSLICHQQPARSFHQGGAQYPVCARCHGLYVGALVGVVAWALFATLRDTPHPSVLGVLSGRMLPRTLLAVGVPTAASVALAAAGLWDASNLTRALLALPLGAVIGAVVAAVMARDLR